MARSIRSGFWRANSQMTGQPIELPTSVADSSSRSSMKAAAAAARSGTSSGLEGAAAATEPGKVGDQGVELAGEALGRRHQVPAGEAEAVQVHHHRRVG